MNYGQRATLPLRQFQMMNQLILFIKTHGYPPTRKELMVLMNIKSTNGVTDHLLALEKKGFIKREKEGGSRAIAVLKFANGDPAITTVVSRKTSNGEE